MNAEMIIEKIRDSIENYEVFKELALDIRFRKADRRFFSWEQGVEGMVVHLFRFADGINEDNIVETITQCRLMRMADNEEWEDDFWDSMEDRLIVLNSLMCIRDDLIIKEVHLKPLDTKECLDNDSIVICNQNMLVSHLINMESGRGIFKGNLSTIVVDEAHNLESKFMDAFTTSFSQREISREILKVTHNRKNTMSRFIIETLKMVDTLFNFLKNDISQQQASAGADMSTFYYRTTMEIKQLLLKLRSNMIKS